MAAANTISNSRQGIFPIVYASSVLTTTSRTHSLSCVRRQQLQFSCENRAEEPGGERALDRPEQAWPDRQLGRNRHLRGALIRAGIYCERGDGPVRLQIRLD